jgi:hypothetical protein
MSDDVFERIQRIKDRAEQRLNELAAVTEKFSEESAKMEMELLLADALAALRAAAGDCKHERVRIQINGVRNQIQRALAG